MSQQSEAKKHVCVLCNTKLDTKEELQEHFRKHANKEIDNRGRPCKQLQPAAKTTKQPVPNRASATKPSGKSDEIICDVCGQEFENVTIAIQHKFRKHPESAAKHFCPYCGMQFPLKINRDKHLSDHPDKKPEKMFPCEDCGVVFYNEEAQSYHVKSTHKRIVAFFQPVATPPPSKKIKLNNAGEAQSVYYCHLCGFEYIMKFNLQKHLERQHSEAERNSVPEDLIKCTTCDALFYCKKAYDNHNMYHKPGDLYVTSEEQRLQTVSRVDQDFDIRRVQSTAEKFIPTYRRPKSSHMPKKKLKISVNNKVIKEEPSEDLSSSSSCDSSDSESNIPLSQRLSKTKKVNSVKKV
ncbi:PR domain zinc finger protein 5-like [Schistocerca gregaria]|uniref:PR domain zinc finger protein 5-like n=1 Tax=Schistocerca gregaria TaxID=7010 RepID=UPI00211E8474|nr:PR domain zinc finger protein 5-like [Schistocerca gregaria]